MFYLCVICVGALTIDCRVPGFGMPGKLVRVFPIAASLFCVASPKQIFLLTLLLEILPITKPRVVLPKCSKYRISVLTCPTGKGDIISDIYCTQFIKLTGALAVIGNKGSFFEHLVSYSMPNRKLFLMSGVQVQNPTYGIFIAIRANFTYSLKRRRPEISVDNKGTFEIRGNSWRVL